MAFREHGWIEGHHTQCPQHEDQPPTEQCRGCDTRFYIRDLSRTSGDCPIVDCNGRLASVECECDRFDEADRYDAAERQGDMLRDEGVRW